MSLNLLEHDSLFVVLHLRDNDDLYNNYHWSLYYHRDADTGGTKYHIKGTTGRWITDHSTTRGVFKSFLLTGLLRVARVPPESSGFVDATIRSFDAGINKDPHMTCRVWVLSALARLSKEVDGYRIVKCDDFAGLEAEILAFGNEHAEAAVDNVQPRPVASSRICGM